MDLKLALKYLTNSASKNENDTFEKWLTQTETNRKKYEDFVAGWDKSIKGVKDFNPDANKAWNKFTANIKITETQESVAKKTIFISQWRSIAAAAVILIATGLFLLTHNGAGNSKTTYVVYNTQDSIKSVILADGSAILLNRYTELRVPHWGNKEERTVYLSGEAFFEVTHDPERPFLVNTDHTTTRVLGTAFNLSTFENKDIVALVSGKIEFYVKDAEEEAAILAPGEMFNFNHQSQKFEQSQYPDKNFLAWKTGELDFKDTPLPRVLDEIADFYHLSFSGNISGYENYTLTANFRKQPIEKLITVLELTWNARISVASDTLYLNFNPIN